MVGFRVQIKWAAVQKTIFRNDISSRTFKQESRQHDIGLQS